MTAGTRPPVITPGAENAQGCVVLIDDGSVLLEQLDAQCPFNRPRLKLQKVM